MDAENYVIQYPLDAVHVDKFADLLGKPKTAVSEMVKANKLPIIELRDPCKPKARAGEKWVFIPEFNRAVREAFYNRPVEQRDAWLLWMGFAKSVTRQYLLPVVRLIRQPRVVFPVSQSLKQKTNITGERHEYSY